MENNEKNNIDDVVEGVDLEEEIRKLNNNSSGYNPEQKFPVVQGNGFSGFQEIFSDKKKVIGVVLGVAIIVITLFIGLLWFNKGKNSNNSGKSSDPQIKQADKNNRSVFKVSIQPAVDAQEAKGRIAEQWRAASVEYSKTQDLSKFKETLNKINEERTSYLEKINADDDNKLNTIVINALNNQREYLNKAFNVESSGDAISIFNEWNSGDKSYDEEYIETLKAMLQEIGIKFTVSKTNNKTTINY